MKFKFKRSDYIGVLTFGGELTSEHEDELKSILMSALNTLDYVVLNFSEVTVVDHACSQLIRSAYQASLRLKKRIKLIGMHPELFGHTVEYKDRLFKFNSIKKGVKAP